MYKRFMLQLFLFNMVFLVGWFSVKALQINRTASTPAFKLQLLLEEEGESAETKDSFFKMLKSASSEQRVVEYNVLEQTSRYNISDEDYEILIRIVEAEAGSEDEKGRMLVAGVVMNRVENSNFPNSVKGVVFQKQNDLYQFSPLADGRYYSVKVSDKTVEAVDKVLAGEDVSEGALYFASRKAAEPEKMKWFDNSLTKLFSYGGHEFFY